MYVCSREKTRAKHFLKRDYTAKVLWWNYVPTPFSGICLWMSVTDCPYQLKDPPVWYLETNFSVHFRPFRKPKASSSAHARNSYVHVMIKSLLEDSIPFVGSFSCSTSFRPDWMGQCHQHRKIRWRFFSKEFIADDEAHDSKAQFCRLAEAMGTFYGLFSCKSRAFLTGTVPQHWWNWCICMALFVASCCLYLLVRLKIGCFDFF